MDREYINAQLIEILCKDFQTLWLIKLEDMSIKIYKSGAKKSIPNSVSIASAIKTYDDARRWYIANCVVESYRERLMERTEMTHILSKLSGDEPYGVEYYRIQSGEINYNQIYYDKILNPADGLMEYVVMGFRDIDLAKNSEIDNLTGLLTREAFFRKAEEMMWANPEQSYDIIMSDVMDFKKVNEAYGVKTADGILRWEGKYLNGILSHDIIAGRYGGDQLVIFGSTDAVQNCMVEHSLLDFVKAEKGNGLPSVKVKFGVYVNVNHNNPIIASCDKAHMALNSIKHHYEKDVAYYTDEIRAELEKKRRIENSMHASLENADFKVYYQPKHDAKTGQLVGAEALVRWEHPEYGFLSPADFIPLFELNGFIVENDRYVWKKTCENLKKWEQKGLKNVPISVNASKLTMLEAEVVSHMKMSIAEYGVSPDLLHIEITETLMTENVAELVNKLNSMRNMGFKVELDDFGAGYSSMNVLSVLPIDIVKLDMSFMQQFGDAKRAKILEACINLAKELGFKTVSEGVEIFEQKELLSQLGVDAIQGYYYSKPLPEDEFEAYLKEHMSA